MSIFSTISYVKGDFLKQKISRQLDEIETSVLGQIADSDLLVKPYLQYIYQTKGKKIRPSLSLLISHLLGLDENKAIEVAAIAESIHIATLIHDDVIDDSSMRRNQQTANSKWGNTNAVLLGDYLFCHTLALSAKLRSFAFSDYVSYTVKQLCIGEIKQNNTQYQVNLTEEEYFYIIERKTAILFEAAITMPALYQGVDEELITGLKQYGFYLGVAYQIYDDCLDLVGSSSSQGKKLHVDFQNGKYTLPILHALQLVDEKIRQRLQQENQHNTVVDINDYFIKEQLQVGINYAKKKAHANLAIAKQRLTLVQKYCQTEHLTTIHQYFYQLLVDLLNHC